jgi:hypothetical protein
VARVTRHDRHPCLFRMSEDVVAPADAYNLPPSSLQCPDHVGSRHAGGGDHSRLVPDDLMARLAASRTNHPPSALAPAAISATSWVMRDWRALFRSSVSSATSSLAFSVAFFIATIRAECSEAIDSRNAW